MPIIPPSSLWLHISIQTQQLWIIKNQKKIQSYSISTALNGAGCQKNSGCTPLGWHQIQLKIGASCPIYAVFVQRRSTGEIYTPDLAKQYPQRDWILTRILWLSGQQLGVNRGGEVDTLSRFIYIHGTPETEPMGIAKSHGCIRMQNNDLISLFDQVENKTPVLIEKPPCSLS